MSTQFSQYVFYGVRIPYENNTYEKYEPYLDDIYKSPREGLTVLYDGRDGRYILIGHIRARSDDIDSVIDGPLNLEEIKPSEGGFLAELITAKFGIENPELSLWFVTEYH